MNNKPARKVSSPLISRIISETDPKIKYQIEAKMAIAAKLDDLILEKGWNKKEFANRVNRSPSEISKWLSGTHNFTVETLTEIAVALEIKLEELFISKPQASVFHIELMTPTPLGGSVKQSYKARTP